MSIKITVRNGVFPDFLPNDPRFIDSNLLPDLLRGGETKRLKRSEIVIKDGVNDGLKAKLDGSFNITNGDVKGGKIKEIKLLLDGKVFQVWKVDWTVQEVTRMLKRMDSGDKYAFEKFLSARGPLDIKFLPGSDGYDLNAASHGNDRMVVHGPSMSFAGLGNDHVVLKNQTKKSATFFVWAGRGDDTVNGSNRKDSMAGQQGDDRLFGNDGEDNLSGGPGSDRLFGGADADYLDGDPGPDLLSGQHGRDHLEGGPGPDRLDGGAGNDSLFGDKGDDFLDGGSGNDRLESFHGDDTLRGGKNDDTLIGEMGKDRLFGDAGDDSLISEDGGDMLDGGPGNDTLRSNTGIERMLGGDGNDVIIANRNYDKKGNAIDKDGYVLASGGSGDDDISGRGILAGGRGNDSIKGDGVLIGGTGNDTLQGTYGNADLFDFRRLDIGKNIAPDGSFGSDTIKNFEMEAGYSENGLPWAKTIDRIRVPGNDYSLGWKSDDEILITVKTNNSVTGRITLEFNSAPDLALRNKYLFAIERAIDLSGGSDDFYF